MRHSADKCNIKLGLCNSFSQGPAETTQQEIGAVSVLGDKMGNVNSWEHKPGGELTECTCSPATGQPAALGTPCPRELQLFAFPAWCLPAVGTPRCHSPEQWGTCQLTIRVPRPSHPERCSPALPPFLVPKMSLSQGKAVYHISSHVQIPRLSTEPGRERGGKKKKKKKIRCFSKTINLIHMQLSSFFDGSIPDFTAIQ